jgi:hypothetical protein
LKIRAEVLNELQTERENRPVAFRGDFVVIDVTAAVNGGEEVLADGPFS